MFLIKTIFSSWRSVSGINLLLVILLKLRLLLQRNARHASVIGSLYNFSVLDGLDTTFLQDTTVKCGKNIFTKKYSFPTYVSIEHFCIDQITRMKWVILLSNSRLMIGFLDSYVIIICTSVVFTTSMIESKFFPFSIKHKVRIQFLAC